MNRRILIGLGALLYFVTPTVWGMKIISLLPSNTEILEALGVGNEIVGVSRYDRMPAHGHAERIGDLMQPNMEKIVSLHPDLIVAGYWESSHIVPRLRRMGYTVLEIRNPRSLQEIYNSITQIAQAVERPEAAGPVIDTMKKQLAEIGRRTRALPRRLRTYVEIDRPYWTIGGHDFMAEAITLAGADNIFADLPQQAAQVSPEVIMARNPDLIISFEAKRPEIAERPGWSTIAAVRNGYIIDTISQEQLTHPSPVLVTGVEALLRRIEILEKE